MKNRLSQMGVRQFDAKFKKKPVKEKASTRAVLKAIRSTGLSARSGFDQNSKPWAEHSDVVVIENVVVNIQVYPTFCREGWDAPAISHPDYRATQLAYMDKVKAALDAAGVEYRQSLPDQLLINGYKSKGK